jgi:hypothetical protein
MTAQRAAEIQVVLEGVSLPASKQQLVAYARREDADAATTLDALPDRDYRALDEVGEALVSVQPQWSEPERELPREESGDPPGRESYTDSSPEPGAIRPNVPPGNPPEKAIEEQSMRRDREQERQKQLG